jgi:hypothetical protein
VGRSEPGAGTICPGRGSEPFLIIEATFREETNIMEAIKILKKKENLN